MIGTDFDIGGLGLPAQSQGPRRSELGQEEFLELMIAQIQNQDPFEPIENGAFVGQLAQFSTVTGISEISKSVSSLTEALLSNQTLQASTIVGRSVLVESGRAVLGANGPLQGSVEMPIDAAAATVRISDQAGQLVRELDIVGSPGGLADFAWDGTTRTGERAPAGRYTIEAFAEGAGGTIGASTFATLKVVSVSIDPSGKGSRITTEDGQQLRLTQVRAVM